MTGSIGVPGEAGNHGYRVGITPAGVREPVRHGPEVFAAMQAGVGSSIPDADQVGVVVSRGVPS